MKGIKDMNRMQFRAPTEYYCESLAPIDEQICAVLAKRREISQNNPGFPYLDMISAWCHRYELNEELMRSIFASLYFEHRFFPQIEPKGFIGFVPVLKSVEMEEALFTITHIKKYKNASMVYVEAEADLDEKNARFERTHFELFISKEYVCRPNGGCGSNKGIQRSFVVIPPLPDDVNELEFRITVKPHEAVPVTQPIQRELTVTIK